MRWDMLGEARGSYREAIRLSPQMAQACVNLGRTWQEEGEWDEALPWLRRAVEIEPRSLVFLALLAEAAVERELFDEAIACYERMLEIDPKLAATHNALGMAAAGIGPSRRIGEPSSNTHFPCDPTSRSRRSTWAESTRNWATLPQPRSRFGRRSPTSKSRSRRLGGWPCCCAAAFRTNDIKLIEQHLDRLRRIRPEPGQPALRSGRRLRCSRLVLTGRRNAP